MPKSLVNYPAWLGQVNKTLGELSNNIFSAEDFDYPWIEKFMAGKTAEEAAKEALAADGFIVENLPAPAMFYGKRFAPPRGGGEKCAA